MNNTTNNILVFLVLAFALTLTHQLCLSPQNASAANFNKRIVGYFVQWGIYARDYEPADIPASHLTHINYAFIEVEQATGELASVDAYADMQKVFPAKNGLPAQTWEQAAANQAGNFGRLRDLKALHPHLKVLLSIGGWTLSAPFPTVAADPTLRQAFANSAAAWVSEQGFDGIDIDWEYPTQADTDNFTALIQATRQALDAQGQNDGKTYLLTLATAAAASKIQALDLESLDNHVDWINIMSYDYHGGWESTTGHLAPLYENPTDPSPDKATLNVDATTSAYIDGGFPAAKLHVGLPFYGRSWETVPATGNGLFQPGQAGPNTGAAGNWENGVLDYWKILEIAADGNHTTYFDNNSKVPYIYGNNISTGLASGGLFASYESIASLQEKIAWAKQLGLGGFMFWELSGDVRDVSDSQSLLGQLSRSLQNGGNGDLPWLLPLLGQ